VLKEFQTFSWTMVLAPVLERRLFSNKNNSKKQELARNVYTSGESSLFHVGAYCDFLNNYYIGRATSNKPVVFLEVRLFRGARP
jgi:hypothetical protein